MKAILCIVFFCCFAIASEYGVFDANGKKLTTVDVSNAEEILFIKVKNPTSFFKQKKKNVYGLKNNGMQAEFENELTLQWPENTDTVWLEIDKNSRKKICFENYQIKKYHTDLANVVMKDNCIYFTSPSDIRAYQILLTDSYNNSKTIFFAINMKHMVFLKEMQKIGFNGGEYSLKNNSSVDFKLNRVYPDPERFIQVDGEYLVDKYPVTNCDFLKQMKKKMNLHEIFENGQKEKITSFWRERLDRMDNGKMVCESNDSAANVIYLYQALIYANQRSMSEKLEPYYIFEKTDQKESILYSDSSFTISNSEKKSLVEEWFKVSINPKSNGYRLPYYDEWMFLARGGQKKGEAIWGDSSATLEIVLKYAWFGDKASYINHMSKPVGLLKPNGYGLYDIFGLVNEFVLFPGKNPFKNLHNTPSCLKGGDYRTRLKHSCNEIYIDPYWKWINYGYSEINFGNAIGGFRLMRKIK